MPLDKSMSEREIMHDLKHGRHHKNRSHKQEVAIMMRVKGKRKKGYRR